MREQGELTSGQVADIAASFQEAAVDILVEKSLAACRAVGAPRLAIGGGVAANRRLRELLDDTGRRAGIECFYPPLELCTDNATMIAVITSNNRVSQRRSASPPVRLRVTSPPLRAGMPHHALRSWGTCRSSNRPETGAPRRLAEPTYERVP